MARDRQVLLRRSKLEVVGVRASAVPCDECGDTIERHRKEFDVPTEAALHIAVGVLYGGWACDHVEWDHEDASHAYEALYHREMRERDRRGAALQQIAGLCRADAQAVERGYVRYAGEFEDAIKSRAALATRLLDKFHLPHPPSPYA